MTSVPDRTGKNTHYAEYVRGRSVIAPKILGGVCCNMACAQLGAEWTTEFSVHKGIQVHVTGETSRKCKRKRQTSKRSTKLEKLLKKGQEKFPNC